MFTLIGFYYAWVVIVRTLNLYPIVNIAGTPIDVTVMAGNQTVGLLVGVVILPAGYRLYTPQALKATGPRALGLDMDYKPPRLLKKTVAKY